MSSEKNSKSQLSFAKSTKFVVKLLQAQRRYSDGQKAKF